MLGKYVACIKPSLTKHAKRRDDDANIPRTLAESCAELIDSVMADNSGRELGRGLVVESDKKGIGVKQQGKSPSEHVLLHAPLRECARWTTLHTFQFLCKPSQPL